MPNKFNTSKVKCKARSPPKETHQERRFGAVDVAELMVAITKSEQTVLARIDTMD